MATVFCGDVRGSLVGVGDVARDFHRSSDEAVLLSVELPLDVGANCTSCGLARMGTWFPLAVALCPMTNEQCRFVTENIIRKV